MKNLNIKKIAIFAPIVLTLVGSLTGIMTYSNLGGFVDDFVYSWLKSFLFVLFVIFPISSLFISKLTTYVEKRFAHYSFIRQKLIFAVILGTVLESVLAAGTTMINNGINVNFISNWFSSFIFALPIGIILSFLMGVFVFPKIEEFTKDVKDEDLLKI